MSDITPFESSNIKGAKHEGTELTVVFNSGSSWKYFDVPEDVWTAFCGAPSKGKFFASEIKPKYRGEKLVDALA